MGMDKCKCDRCDQSTGGDLAPGHDQKLRSRLEARAGGLLGLKELIAACEGYSGGRQCEAEVLQTIRRLFSSKAQC